MEPSPPPSTTIGNALSQEDPVALANLATSEELERLRLAEEIFERKYQRQKRTSRIASMSQLVVTIVAMGGLLVNAIQSYFNNEKQQAQSKRDQERWDKEFLRAQQADKYRAFFETSALATDPANSDKRLVGYALLEEFVEDRDYNTKATLMLEESLDQELRGNTAEVGLDESHRNSIAAILSALAHTDDCRALEKAARSIAKVGRRHAKVGDIQEVKEVFDIYVWRLLGRASVVCSDMKEFHAVRKPLRETVMRLPAIADLQPPVNQIHASQRISQILRDRCEDDMTVNGASDCAEAYLHHVHLCYVTTKGKLTPEDASACEVILPVAKAVYPRFVKLCEPVPDADEKEAKEKRESPQCKLVASIASTLAKVPEPPPPPEPKPIP